MKYASEMGSGAMNHIPSFLEIGSAIEKLMGGGIYKEYGDLISLILRFQTKKSRIKT
jgi:hypothetical protein